MADSNNRVRIDFDVNAQELKEITQAINILDKFNKQASQVVAAVGNMGNAFDNSNKKTKQAKNEYVNLDRAMNAWNDRLKSNQSMMSSYEAAQAKLTDKLKAYGRDVKVSVDETGKLSASFKNAEGNIVSMTGKYDAANNAIKGMKTTLSTTALEVKAKAEADRKATQEMNRLYDAAKKMDRELENQKKRYQELTRGTDLSQVLRNNGESFNIMTRAVKANGEVVRAATDRNGKFSQTLRMQDGSLRTITGYYDQVNKKLVQYSESVSRADGNMKKAESSTQRFGRQLTNLERSMQGLNKYTLTWADAIEIAGTRMLQWNVAGTVIFGMQRAFRSLLSTIVEIDTQMTQLVRVLPDTTDFNMVIEDSIRLSTEFGRTLTDINESLITFARSGFDNVDTRFLTEAATLMANVSDIDMFDASESITSAITLFNVKARDSIQVVNKLNEVDNDYAISTTQLAKSITRAGGTAASFGVDLNELLGHTTAIGVATRESGQIIGNSLKTIYSRINTLPKAEAAIKGLGVAMTLPNGDNRDVADILNDVAAVWPHLNNAKKQSAAMDIAGTYQLSRFLAMMNNYKMGLDATKTAQHSYNSAVNENAKFMASLLAKINLLKGAAQQLAMALGKAGMYKAIQVVLEGLINLTQGFIGITETLGKFTFALPVAAAAIGLFAAHFQRTRLEMVAFQAAMIGMNTNLSRQALMMAGTATTTNILGMAFGTLRTAALGLTAALLTNPLTWIAVAITVIPMLIGHFKRLKAEQEALRKRAEDNTKAFKDFKKEISKGDVNQTSLDVYTSKMDVAKKSLENLKKAQDTIKQSHVDVKKAMSGVSGEYATMNMKVIEQANWQDALSKKTKEELADIGIKYDKYKSLSALMSAVKDRQNEYKDAVATGNKVLKDSEKQLMFNADAFDEVGESVKETMDTMQLFFGVNDEMVQELTGSYNAIMTLAKVKNKDAAQTQALEQAWAVWEARLGTTREEIMKNPDAMKKNIEWQLTMKDKWGEATQKILTNEQQKQLAIDITKQKTKEAADATAIAEKEAADKKAKAAEEEAKRKAKAAEEEAARKAKAFGELRKNMTLNESLNLGMTQKEIANATARGDFNKSSAEKSIAAMMGENKQTSSTKEAYGQLKEFTNNANSVRQQKVFTTVDTIKKDLGIERKETVDTKNAYGKLKDFQNGANSIRQKNMSGAVAGIKGSLEGERKQAGTTAKGHQDAAAKVSTAAKNQKDNVIKNATTQNKEHKRLSSNETTSVTSGWDKLWSKVSSIMNWIKGLFGIKSSKKSGGGATRAYANGTSASGHVGGPAIVGEEGPELAHIPNFGTTIVGQRGPEMLDLPKGTSVLPNKQTENILKSYGFPAYAGGVGDFFDAITKGPKAVWETGMSKFGASDSLIPSWFTKLSGSPMKAITGMAVEKIKSMLEGAMGSFGNFSGGGAKMAQAAIMQALKITGKPMSWLSPMMQIAQKESGFNPKAINNWDINARRGDPSVGLFQVIGATFRRYMMSGMGDRTNPVHSAVAAIRYMDSRYGGVWGHPGIRSMSKGGGYKPYANGGMIDKPHMGLVGEAGPEAIIPLSPNKRSRAMELYQQTGRALGVTAYANGGIVGSYTVKTGDTLSELAKQFKTTIKNLMAMNKSIKDADRIYKGQKLNVGSSSSKSPSAPAKKPVVTYSREKSDELVQGNTSYVNWVQGLGLQNDSTYTTSNLRYRRNYYVNASNDNKRSYDTEYAEALKKYTNLSSAKSDFNNAGLFNLDKAYIDRLWGEIEKSVQSNIRSMNDDKFGQSNDYLNYMQGMGAKNYDSPQHITWALKQSEETVRGANVETQKDYNTQMAQALRNFEDLEEARKRFDSQAWFGLNQQQKDSVWAGIEEAVKSNAFGKLEESSGAWLDTFNAGLTEANGKVQTWLSLVNDIQKQQESATKDKFINSTVAAGMANLGMGENLTPEEILKKRMDEIKAETEDRLTQNAELAYANDPAELQKRLDQIGKDRKAIEDQIKATTSSAVTNGLSAADQAKLLQPLQDALTALNKEYDLLNTSSADAANITTGNTSAVEALAKEYAELMKQLEAATLKEKVDEFGNIVRNLSGANAMVSVAAASVATGNQLITNPTAPVATPDGVPVTYNQQSNSSEDVSEPKTYDVGTGAKNVTYIINAGVAIGSESELREFAKMLNGLVEEEEGRGES